MEQTRRDTVIELLCAGHRPAALIMALGVISSNGSVMPPHFFGLKEKVNTEFYLNVLKTVVVPWMDSVASGTLYTFQQDSAPAHKANSSVLAEENVPNFWDLYLHL
ncbi:Uncharacterized protein FKW44_005285 [Caligus rogercresseyi]|uniref:Uncharacterized protein n=1 Tax=Caligus rogercresseyi TaxID=217165 RepID=A0A7T8QRW8_CALRO|nr:Uncharacterized protein FKW44_005285 [Caligus rogercresseyi]